jgi:hypothetical protein
MGGQTHIMLGPNAHHAALTFFMYMYDFNTFSSQIS